MEPIEVAVYNQHEEGDIADSSSYWKDHTRVKLLPGETFCEKNVVAAMKRCNWSSNSPNRKFFVVNLSQEPAYGSGNALLIEANFVQTEEVDV